MAMADRKPILGICRGMQTLAVASGGTLYQHLPDIVEEEHGIGEGNGYDALVERAKHPITLTPHSHVARIFRSLEVDMNTGHHQAVATPGNELRITGRSPQGVAEFLEHADPSYFCIGVQGHPEAQDDATAARLFDAFADATCRTGQYDADGVQ
jgi:putative glutamine amidotransferase